MNKEFVIAYDANGNVTPEFIALMTNYERRNHARRLKELADVFGKNADIPH